MEPEKILNYETTLYTYIKRFYSKEYKITFNTHYLEQNILEKIKQQAPYNEIADMILIYLQTNITDSKKSLKLEEYTRLLALWNDNLYPYIFIMALKLNNYKTEICNTIKFMEQQTESSATPLSLTYDNITVSSVYIMRTVATPIIVSYLQEKSKKDSDYIYINTALTSNSIDVIPALIPIIFESLRQSTTSKGGANYEDLVYKYLLNIGLDNFKNNIERFNHDDVGSLENDFKFTFNGKKFGISAKKTFRERYKQYVNLKERSTDVDIFLTISLGTDLTEEKTKTIRAFGVYIFIAPEVYNAHNYLQNTDGVYSIFDLNLNLLTELTSSNII